MPTVVLALAGGALVLVNRRPAHPGPFDLIALVQVMIALVAVVYAIKEASTR
ncbi:MAG: hypothetical protein ACK41Y_07085 [Paracoccus hibiscisoli]|uniref:hypothetical protein n=1 Tax=Paracoccus hibiscisoli TaxID=2023261 RepID=UPI003919E6D1